MTTPRVVFEVGDDHVGTVTLNRPEKLNAMDWPLFEALHEVAAAARDAIAERACRTVLVIGAGRAFSAGLDLSTMRRQAGVGGGKDARPEPPDDTHLAWLQDAFNTFEDLPAPVIAAVRGPAVGAGCQLALACHLRVAADDAQFGLLESRWGLIPDLGATYRLPRLVGLGRAADLAVFGRLVTAATAHAWGLVNEVLDRDDFPAAARAYAAELAAGPPVAIGALPALMRDNLLRDRASALAAERATQARCVDSADFREAVAAGRDGREPMFSGG